MSQNWGKKLSFFFLAALFLSVLTVAKTEAEQNNLKIRTIIIDPGHGGKDPGAVSRSRLKEKTVVLDIAKRLKRKLSQDKTLRVYLTRDRDKFVSLGRRASFANRKKGDLFISIHANSAFSSRASGFETYYLSESVDDTSRAVATRENSVIKLEEMEDMSRKQRKNSNLETILWDLKYTEFRNQSIELAKITQRKLDRILRIRNRGVKSAPFYVLKKVAMPSVLVEVGFISSPRDEALLRDSNAKEKIARALADSILAYKKKYEKEKGFTR